MLEEEQKIGPKGQIAISEAIRKALKMQPGTKVVISLEENKVIVKKPPLDAAAIFKKSAKQIRYNKKIDPNEAYTESLEAHEHTLNR